MRRPLLILVALLASLALVPTGSALAATPSLSAGFDHTCALAKSGRLTCFGWDTVGISRMGPGAQWVANSGRRNSVLDPANPIVGLGINADRICVVRASGNAECVDDTYSQWNTVPWGGRVTQFTSGYGHECALLETGKVRCRGSNFYGQVGTPDGVSSSSPVDIVTVPFTGPVKLVRAGLEATCALLVNGSIECVGNNRGFRFGGNMSQSSTPLKLPFAYPSASFGIGDEHICASTAQWIQCLGRNDHSQIGFTPDFQTHDTPVLLAGFEGQIREVTAGFGFTCVLTNWGKVTCMGTNLYNRLGQPDSFNEGWGTVTLSKRAVAISAGNAHACVQMFDGTVECWGSNMDEQLGVGGPNSATPQVVPGLNLRDVPDVRTATLGAVTFKRLKASKRIRITFAAQLFSDGSPKFEGEDCTGVATATLQRPILKRSKRKGGKTKVNYKAVARRTGPLRWDSFNGGPAGCFVGGTIDIPQSFSAKRLRLKLVVPVTARSTEVVHLQHLRIKKYRIKKSRR